MSFIQPSVKLALIAEIIGNVEVNILAKSLAELCEHTYSQIGWDHNKLTPDEQARISIATFNFLRLIVKEILQ